MHVARRECGEADVNFSLTALKEITRGSQLRTRSSVTVGAKHDTEAIVDYVVHF
jgi:hypothetical protein